MKSVLTMPYSVVSSIVPTPHKTRSTRAMRHGATKVLRPSSGVGLRSSIAQRRAITVRRVIQYVPHAEAATM